MNQGRTDEAKRTFLTCADIPDENLKDPHAHKSSVTSCLYNLGKLLHEQGHQEVKATFNTPSSFTAMWIFSEKPSNVFWGVFFVCFFQAEGVRLGLCKLKPCSKIACVVGDTV